MNSRRPKIAVAAGHMPFFDPIMPPGHRDDRSAFGARAAETISALGEVEYLGLVSDADAGTAAGRRLAALSPEAILLVPTMASPARYLWNVIAQAPNVPVVLWCAQEATPIDTAYDMPALCRHSQNVGALMIGNMLSRAGRPFLPVTGSLDSSQARDSVREAVEAAVVAGRIAKARIGRFGTPLDGYDNVDVDAAALQAATGTAVIDIALDEWEQTISDVREEQVDGVLDAMRTQARLRDFDAQGASFRLAARMAAAMETVAGRHELTAGTINCRGVFGVGNPGISSLACLAVSYLTGQGVPFTCTADLITAVAMLAGRTLGGASLYCELDAIDFERDAFLCSNTGEADTAWSSSRQDCTVFATSSDSGRPSQGCSLCQRLTPGRATMIGFSPRARAPSGFTFIAMEGETLEEHPQVALSVTSAWFRARQRPMNEAFNAWLKSGATHHGSLSPGWQGNTLRNVAELLGVGCLHV